MSRLFRWLFNGLAAASLLAATLWIVAHILPGAYPAIHLAHQRELDFDYTPYSGWRDAIALVHITQKKVLERGSYSTEFVATVVYLIPYWLIVLLAGLPTAIRIVVAYFKARERALKLRFGLCLTCGYDLHATPARCPECGTIASKQ